jgi:hypothetical protein
MHLRATPLQGEDDNQQATDIQWFLQLCSKCNRVVHSPPAERQSIGQVHAKQIKSRLACASWQRPAPRRLAAPIIKNCRKGTDYCLLESNHRPSACKRAVRVPACRVQHLAKDRTRVLPINQWLPRLACIHMCIHMRRGWAGGRRTGAAQTQLAHARRAAAQARAPKQDQRPPAWRACDLAAQPGSISAGAAARAPARPTTTHCNAGKD